MTKGGGVVDKERVFATELGPPIVSIGVKSYGGDDLEALPKDYPEHGCSFVILPASSQPHLRLAARGAALPGLFDGALVGWVAGCHLDELGSAEPKVFDGTTLQRFSDRAVVMHADVDAGFVAKVDILNPFEQGTGDVITFPDGGFEVERCSINGEPANFAEYLERAAIDTQLPLVANFGGALVNVSFQGVEKERKRVKFYAPVFEGVEYRLASQLEDYAAEFERQLAQRKDTPMFACNCILNFLYAKLEGRSTGEVTGPITFGEIAYILLNQTLVYVTFDKTA